MKKFALILTLLASPAFAEEAAPVQPVAPVPAATPAPAPGPALWSLELDQQDIQTLNACVMELPKRTADPFIARLNGKLKPVK